MIDFRQIVNGYTLSVSLLNGEYAIVRAKLALVKSFEQLLNLLFFPNLKNN